MKSVGRYIRDTLWGKAVVSVAVIVITVIVQELYSLNEHLSAPLHRLAAWETQSMIGAQLKFFMLFILYLSPIIVMTSFLWSWLRGTEAGSHDGHGEYKSRYDYDKLIAELVQAISDRTVSNELKAEKVNVLFHALIDDFCTLYQVERSEVRVVLVSNDRGRERLTGWRWGRPITKDQERMDLKAISMFLETEKTYPTWIDVREQFPNGDSDTLLFIRNKGDQLHLGCLIAVSKPVDTQSRIREWEQIVYPLTMLGHMDKLVRFVVQYK